MRPYSKTFDDHYWSGGAAEKSFVFLRHNNLAARFAQGGAFTVAELGFGTGLNLLLAQNLFRRTAPAGARLTFISYEQFPLTRDDLAQIHAPFPPELQPLSAQFLSRYAPQPGWNLVTLAQTTLHLFAGPAHLGLQSHPHPAHAWFLDGFAPAKNPTIWTPGILRTVAQNTVPGGTFATYTAAAAVREALKAAGFKVERTPGHPPKRHMLSGRLSAPGRR